MKIRKAKLEDIKKIVEIFRTEYRKYPYNDKWSKKNALKQIKDYFKTRDIFVLEIDKEIIGFIISQTYIWGDEKQGYIEEIVISKKFQGKGYGKKLMDYIEKFFKKKNVEKILLMSVKRAKAFKIYKKLGYKEDDFVSMSKKLK